jgi:hypothetical protein
MAASKAKKKEATSKKKASKAGLMRHKKEIKDMLKMGDKVVKPRPKKPTKKKK